MKAAKRVTAGVADVTEGNARAEASVLRLRLLIEELINEVDSLDERTLGFSETLMLLDNRDRVDFYEEVARFEAALIRRALRRTNGHQLDAARLLNMNPSTLNAKIKQYKIRDPLRNDE
jgi:DNA-binding NtrC family response regulator